MIIQHPNAAHQATCIAAEGARQQGVAAAIAAGGGSSTVAAAVRTAEIAFYRTVIASAVANGQQSAQFGQALRDLGTGGA
ncbi:ferritin-like metal-binding protein YciE [Bradyrhizobium sp. AZCC 2230]